MVITSLGARKNVNPALLPCKFHRIRDFNANYIHLQELAFRLSKVVRNEESASASSGSYVNHSRSVYSYTNDHANMIDCLTVL